MENPQVSCKNLKFPEISVLFIAMALSGAMFLFSSSLCNLHY